MLKKAKHDLIVLYFDLNWSNQSAVNRPHLYIFVTAGVSDNMSV